MFSGLGPGITETSSQPSSPQLSRICLVAWTSSGTVAYYHICMPAQYRPAVRPGRRPHGVTAGIALGGYPWRARAPRRAPLKVRS